MNLAFVGLGKIANYHLQAIAQVPDFQIIGGYDLQVSQGVKLPPGAIFFQSIVELLADSRVNTVVLLVPSGESKFELSKQILAAGKNLITEKPATRNLAELESLTEIANARDTFVHGAFHSRFSPTAQFVAEQLSSGIYSDTVIDKVEIWADSPHIIDGQVVGKSSEDTSFHGEGPNVLAELLLYFPQVTISQAWHLKYSDDLPEVQTVLKGTLEGNREVIAVTSWVRGVKQKGIKITFADGRHMLAIHTDQKVYDHQGEIIFDGVISDSQTSRMQKEYNELYVALARESSAKVNNLEIIRSVALLMDQVAQISEETRQEYLKEMGLGENYILGISKL